MLLVALLQIALPPERQDKVWLAIFRKGFFSIIKTSMRTPGRHECRVKKLLSKPKYVCHSYMSLKRKSCRAWIRTAGPDEWGLSTDSHGKSRRRKFPFSECQHRVFGLTPAKLSCRTNYAASCRLDFIARKPTVSNMKIKGWQCSPGHELHQPLFPYKVFFGRIAALVPQFKAAQILCIQYCHLHNLILVVSPLRASRDWQSFWYAQGGFLDWN